VSHDVRTLGPDDLRAAHTLFGATVHRPPLDDAAWSYAASSYHPERALGVYAGGELVATAMSLPSETAVPGGMMVPTAAVTRVGVRADHTRRGMLTAMMRAQLADVAARGEPLASLRASEAVIYGRFGYGVATRAQHVRVRADPPPQLRAEAPQAGSVRLLERADILPVLREVYDRIPLRPGGMTRIEGWWDMSLGRRVLVERAHVLAAVHTGPDGDDGFAVAFPVPGTKGRDHSLGVVDLHAADVRATAGLWHFLLGVDLVGWVQAEQRPLDESLELLFTDARAVAVTSQADETWLRIVDVPAALAARSYGNAEPLLLAVRDPLREANTGVYRIADGSAERVGPLGGPTRPELECGITALAMAYLGDRRPSELVATGWWRAPDPAAVPRADAAFAAQRVPWSGTHF
jgi:predicted acetyltransferase